jgi:peptide/nickel transport system permease protein
MFTYIARRLLLLLPVLLGVTLITFALTRIIPGNPIAQLVSPLATPEQRQALAHQHGLDQPLIEQYYTYVKGLAHGDLGTSFTTNQPVREDLTSRFAATFELTFYAMILSMLLGVPLGITAAVWRNGPADHVARVLSVTGIALPVFWTGTTLLYLMFTRWHLVSAPYGRIDPSVDPPHQYTGLYTVDALISGNWTALHSAASALLLPVVVLAFGALAPIARMTRSGMIEALESDYVRAARSLGLPARTVVLRHALANALLRLHGDHLERLPLGAGLHHLRHDAVRAAVPDRGRPVHRGRPPPATRQGGLRCPPSRSRPPRSGTSTPAPSGAWCGETRSPPPGSPSSSCSSRLPSWRR